MASVFVGDLANCVTEAEIYSKFSQLGAVVSVKLCRDKENGKSLGHAYVQYQDLDNAEKAVETFNLDLMHNQHIRVTMAGKSNLCQALQGNVFIKNLDRTVDSNMLYRAFSSFGNILSCKVPHGRKGSKCHGFIQFETEAAACAAISSMNGTMFYGKKLYVCHCINRVPKEPIMETAPISSCNTSSSSLRTVYIKNLSPTVDSVFLKITCSPYGDVTNVKIIRDTDGSSKGFAFVTFKKVEEASKAIEMLNGKEVDSRILFVGAAIKKASRKQQQHQYQQAPQQQHGLQETPMEESITIEQQQQQSSNKNCPQFRHKLHQLLPQYAEAGQLLPTMMPKRQQLNLITQDPQRNCPPQSFPPQMSQCSIQFPTITGCQGQRCEMNKRLQLPQIQQQICNLQQQIQPQNVPELHLNNEQEHLPLHSQDLNTNLQEQSLDSQLQNQQNQQQQAAPVYAPAVPNMIPQGVNLYVKHLDDDVDDTILKEMFSKFGEVISAKVMMEGEKSRGFGFVCFARAEDAACATRDMRRRVDDINRKPLYVAPAQSKEDRQAFFREKLKSRQTDIHSGDVETSEKLINSFETINESDKHEISGCNSLVLNIPGGDNSSTIGKLKISKHEHSKNPMSQGKLANLCLSQSSKKSEFSGCHCMKFASMNRPLPKKAANNLFNFELLNVDNLRTPLIKPTRVTTPMEEATLLCNHQEIKTSFTEEQEKADADCPVPPEFPTDAASPKPPDTARYSSDIVGFRKSTQSSPWRTIDYEDVNILSQNTTPSIGEAPKRLTPIGCKPGSPDTRMPFLRIPADKHRLTQPYFLRPLSTSRLTSSYVEVTTDCNHCHDMSKVSKMSGSDISFTDTEEMTSECFILKQNQPSIEIIYDPLNTLSLSRNSMSGYNHQHTGNILSQESALIPRSYAYSDSEPYTIREDNTLPPPGLRRGFSSNESLITLDQLHVRSRIGSLFPGERHSQSFKRRADVALYADADSSRSGVSVLTHWRAKRQMIALPAQCPEETERCETTALAQAPTPATPGQNSLGLRAMSSWPSDHQKLALAAHIKAQVTTVLGHVLQLRPGSQDSEWWAQELYPIVQLLVSREWTVEELSERLIVMLVEMEVADILNLLQSEDYLIYLISEGLKQIENYEYRSDCASQTLDQLDPATPATSTSVPEPDSEQHKPSTSSEKMDL